MSVTWNNVYSSNVDAIGYDDATGEMLVRWSKGKVSAYRGVPPELADEAARAYSVGNFIHSTIKPRFPHRYVG